MRRSTTVKALIVLFLSYPVCAVSQEESKSLDTLNKKESYSIGYQLGIRLKSDAVDTDFDSFFQGMHDATDGKVPILSRDEMKDLILSRKKNTRDARLRKWQETLVHNAEESKAFLEKNAQIEGVRTTESGLQYKILKPGHGPSPGLEDFVEVHYRGMFPDGKVFDSSYAKGAPQIVQADGVIKGWTEALQMMKAGSKWKIFVPPHLAYGRGGLEPNIPPNKVLVFEIELLSIGNETKESKLK